MLGRLLCEIYYSIEIYNNPSFIVHGSKSFKFDSKIDS
jgi:hypothetical protein